MQKILTNCKLILFVGLLSVASCGVADLPNIPEQKIFDCTVGKNANQICEINFVVHPLTTMTYYNNVTNVHRQLQGYRAIFDNDNGNLVPLLNHTDVKDFVQPIQADGYFRTILVINGKMPGPTIIAYEDQTLKVTVYNEFKNLEGLSIHWHGMYQKGNQEADGVSFITQRPIDPHDKYTYKFKASPAGTHWYHAQSAAQRTDGLYGALIIKDTLQHVYDYDLPNKHTLLLMDWQKYSSFDMLYPIGANLRYWEELDESDQSFIMYNPTRGPDNSEVGPVPFWSGIINDKGRHFDANGEANIAPTHLNYFNVSRGSRYRFRLIGAQALYPFKFSIEGHQLSVIATDGAPIDIITNVDYVIVNAGERYDVVLDASNIEQKNFWIWAETLEDLNHSGDQIFHNPINKHRAEAILHYEDVESMDIEEIDQTWDCTASSKCSTVNCPFSHNAVLDCINVDSFNSLTDHKIPQAVDNPSMTKFLSFGFHGEGLSSTSSVDGVNFRFPHNPPVTELGAFKKSGSMCPTRGCGESYCACTQVVDIKGRTVELVIVNRDTSGTDSNGISHPVHLHGHHFYVVKIGYPDYDKNGVYVNASNNLLCIDYFAVRPCETNFITIEGKGGYIQEVKWKTAPKIENKQFPRKDTVIVPFGGYTIIRFVLDNKGWWFFHCGIEVHQMEGMAIIVKESPISGSSKSSKLGLGLGLGLGLPIVTVVMAIICVYCYCYQKNGYQPLSNVGISTYQ